MDGNLHICNHGVLSFQITIWMILMILVSDSPDHWPVRDALCDLRRSASLLQCRNQGKSHAVVCCPEIVCLKTKCTYCTTPSEKA